MSASASVVLCKLCDPAAAMDQVLQQGTTLGIHTQILFSVCESAVFFVVPAAIEQPGIEQMNGLQIKLNQAIAVQEDCSCWV